MKNEYIKMEEKGKKEVKERKKIEREVINISDKKKRKEKQQERKKLSLKNLY